LLGNYFTGTDFFVAQIRRGVRKKFPNHGGGSLSYREAIYQILRRLADLAIVMQYAGGPTVVVKKWAQQCAVWLSKPNTQERRHDPSRK